MRFCDLFADYKIGLKKLKNIIPFTKLPRYRKIFITSLFVCAVVSGILALLKLKLASQIAIVFCGLFFIVFCIFDLRNKNLEIMLEEHYKPYSESRMKLITEVLTKYNINIHDSDALDMLIKEAKYAQIDSDYLAPFKKPLKTLVATIIPIIAFATEEITDTMTKGEMIIMATQTIVIILLLFSLIYFLMPVLKDFIYVDYNTYNAFIYDIRQLKIFYTKENNAKVSSEIKEDFDTRL